MKRILHRQTATESMREFVTPNLTRSYPANHPAMGRRSPHDVVYRGAAIVDHPVRPAPPVDLWATIRQRHAGSTDAPAPASQPARPAGWTRAAARAPIDPTTEGGSDRRNGCSSHNGEQLAAVQTRSRNGRDHRSKAPPERTVSALQSHEVCPGTRPTRPGCSACDRATRFAPGDPAGTQCDTTGASVAKRSSGVARRRAVRDGARLLCMGPTKSGDRTPVYDADGHICEPPAVWQEYCEPAYRDLIVRAGRRADGRDTVFVEGADLGVSAAGACIPGAYANPAVTWDDIVPGSYDPANRLKVMDAERLDAALLFPSLDLLAGDVARPDVAAANARAYNRWMADFIGYNRERLFAMGLCPLQSVDAAVAEIASLAEHGFTGLTFRPERYAGLELYSSEMDRVWSAAEDHDLTVAIHGSFGSKMTSFARTRYTNQFYIHMVCHPFEQMASVMEVVASGILDDHPRLRIGFFESGLGWLPYWLERLDEHKASMGHLVPRLRREPTEIFSEQCFVTMEAGEAGAFAQVADMGLAHCVVWGSDYPHYDCTYPGALAELQQTFAHGARPDLLDDVLYTNARRFMGLSS